MDLLMLNNCYLSLVQFSGCFQLPINNNIIWNDYFNRKTKIKMKNFFDEVQIILMKANELDLY